MIVQCKNLRLERFLPHALALLALAISAFGIGTTEDDDMDAENTILAEGFHLLDQQ